MNAINYVAIIHTRTLLTDEQKDMVRTIARAEMELPIVISKSELARIYDEAVKSGRNNEMPVWISKHGGRNSLTVTADIVEKISEEAPVEDNTDYANIFGDSGESVKTPENDMTYNNIFGDGGNDSKAPVMDNADPFDIFGNSNPTVENDIGCDDIFGSGSGTSEDLNEDIFGKVEEPKETPVVKEAPVVKEEKTVSVATLNEEVEDLEAQLGKLRQDWASNNVEDIIKMAIKVKFQDKTQTNKIFISNAMLRSFVAKAVANHSCKHTYKDRGLVEYEFTAEENALIDETMAKVIAECELVKIRNGYIIPVQTLVKYGKEVYNKVRYDEKNGGKFYFIIDLATGQITAHNNEKNKDSLREFTAKAVAYINHNCRFIGRVDS